MNLPTPRWITEAEVVGMMDLGQAIAALERGLTLQVRGEATNMSKTHVSWGQDGTLHAIGAAYEGAEIVGTKTWAHTGAGATPLLVLWDARSGALLAVIEAFALGQMRTGGVSGVATRWMADPAADTFAMIGTGKQALAQLAAVAAVRNLSTVRVWGRDYQKREKFVSSVRALGYNFEISTPDSIADATGGAQIVTLATRAQKPFFTAAMASPGAHINAIGAITPEREEFTQDLFDRTDLIVADDPIAARRLSKEFGSRFRNDDASWAEVRPLCELVGSSKVSRDKRALSIFKAMGMGVSDVALGIEVLRRAIDDGRGREFAPPKRMPPRLTAVQEVES